MAGGPGPRPVVDVRSSLGPPSQEAPSPAPEMPLVGPGLSPPAAAWVGTKAPLTMHASGEHGAPVAPRPSTFPEATEPQFITVQVQ